MAVRVTRVRDGAVVGGVCAGIAVATGVEALWVRLAFVATTLAGGVGIVAYIVLMVLLPVRERAVPRPYAANVKEALGIGLLVLAALLVLRGLGIWWSDAIVWPAVLVAAGVVVIWRQSTVRAGEPPRAPAATARPERGTPAPAPAPGDGIPGPRMTPLGELPRFGPRLVAGAGLVAAGAIFLITSIDALGGLSQLVVALVVVAAGMTLIFGTSWLGLLSALQAERTERVRSQERAEMAAHLHDSVLQTLALIQREAPDDRVVSRLARRQERELRDWLAGREAADGVDGATTLAAALRALGVEVEDAHRVEVEVVTVGDAPLDGHARALVAAAREATVNAAKFGGGSRVDVYAEATPERIEVFVRDRGAGFDLATVPPERRGVRESIVGRMARHGGHATLTSAPGAGTEVELTLPRSAT